MSQAQISPISYVQNRISVTLPSQIRYEGTFDKINLEDKTITLTKVRSYGTEDRRPRVEIPPSQIVYECIVFRGADIIDLKVLGPSTSIQNPTEAKADALQTFSESKAKDEVMRKDNSAIQASNEEEKISRVDAWSSKHQLIVIDEDENDDEDSSELIDDLNGLLQSKKNFQKNRESEYKQKGIDRSCVKTGFSDQFSTENAKESEFTHAKQKEVKFGIPTIGIKFLGNETMHYGFQNQMESFNYNYKSNHSLRERSINPKGFMKYSKKERYQTVNQGTHDNSEKAFRGGGRYSGRKGVGSGYARTYYVKQNQEI